MTIPTKVGIGLLTASSVAGVGYLSNSYFLKESNKQENTFKVNNLINNSGEFVLLNLKTTGSEDNEYWKLNWENYKEESKKQDKDIFGLEGWNKSNPTDLTPALKEKCATESIKSVTNIADSIYQNVAKFCTRGVNIEEDMRNKKITVLNTDASGKDAQIWNKRHQNKETLKNNLEKLGISDSENEITEEKIRNACSKSKTKHKKEKDYQAILNAFKEVCIRKTDEKE